MAIDVQIVNHALQSQLPSWHPNQGICAFSMLHSDEIITKSFVSSFIVNDQSTAASWWQHDAINAADFADQPDFFASTHGLSQSHPGVKFTPTAGIKPKGPATGAAYKHLDYRTSATAELRRNPSLSAPDECARACREGEPPRTCYYHFTLEYYTVLGA